MRVQPLPLIREGPRLGPTGVQISTSISRWSLLTRGETIDPGCGALEAATIKPTAPQRPLTPASAFPPCVPTTRLKHQVGCFLGIFEERLARHAQLRTHG